MIYYTDKERTSVYAIYKEEELSFLPSGLSRITEEERDLILESLRLPTSEYEVRSIRNQKLRETDWMLLPDSPMQGVNHDRAIKYRQMLRDLTLHPYFPHCSVPEFHHIETLV